MKKILLMGLAALLSMLPICARADIIAQYTFPLDFAPSNVATGITASTFNSGSAITAVGFDAEGQPPTSWTGENWTTSTNPAVAIASDSYVAFQVTTEPGMSMTLLNLTLDVRPHGSGPDDFVAQVVDMSTTSTVQMGAVMLHSDQSVFDPGRKIWETLSASSASFQDLTGTYEIRIYGYNAAQAGREVLFDNVTLNGSVSVIPEPTTVLLTLFGSGLILRLRRRPRYPQ